MMATAIEWIYVSAQVLLGLAMLAGGWRLFYGPRAQDRIVALDSVGAGEGQLVLIVQGSSARMTEQTKNLPADAVIVGIVDSAQFGGKTFYQAGQGRQ